MTEEERVERHAQLARTMALLVHASGCGNAECPSTNCSKVKGLFHHAVSCPLKVAGGCQLCRSAPVPRSHAVCNTQYPNVNLTKSQAALIKAALPAPPQHLSHGWAAARKRLFLAGCRVLLSDVLLRSTFRRMSLGSEKSCWQQCGGQVADSA